MRKFGAYFVLALMFFGTLGVIAQDATIASKIQRPTPDKLSVISGGTLEILSGATFTNAGTFTSSGVIAVSDADELTVGGVIVPQYEEITVPILPHASLTEQNLYTATQAITVVSIRVVPDLVQGGALTGTIVKCTGTATPANGTTPMHTANAIDFNATAHTVQSITLTSTAADLALAAGERIGLDLSAALTTGRAVVTIRYKRS